MRDVGLINGWIGFVARFGGCRFWGQEDLEVEKQGGLGRGLEYVKYLPLELA